MTLRDRVPTVDKLSTREALELELVLTAYVPLHSTECGSNSHKSFFTAGGGRSEHFVR
jgi:hypothetical protein